MVSLIFLLTILSCRCEKTSQEEFDEITALMAHEFAAGIISDEEYKDGYLNALDRLHNKTGS